MNEKNNVVSILDLLPRTDEPLRRFAAHHVDLRFLQKAAQSVLWGWTSANGDVPIPLPEELETRVFELLDRHVRGAGTYAVDEDEDRWAFCFTATAEDGSSFGYSLEVATSWGRAG